MTEIGKSTKPAGGSKSRLTIIVAVIIVVVLVGGTVGYLELVKPKPSVPNVLTDTAQTAAPDYLDPATGFFVQDETVFTSVYQELVEYNGSSVTGVNCVLADKMYVQNNQNYTFDLRNYVTFSTGTPVNASTVWFSFYRGLIMGQGPYVDNYGGTLFNVTAFGITSISIPWGSTQALMSAGYSITGNLTQQTNETANDLATILSNFNYNSTEMKVMEYKDQAVVVNSQYNVTLKSINPYAFFPEVISEWWGAVVDPSFVDAHGGVQVGSKNSYIDLNGVPGTGPYEIKSIAPSFSDIVLQANPNYWAVGHAVPTEAQPALIPQIVIDFGLSHVDRLTEFDKNQSQISVVGPSTIKDLVTGYYNSSATLSDICYNPGAPPDFFDLSMNTNSYWPYTNNTDFRHAIYYAMNYTALMDIYTNSYNGKSLATEILGPVTPNFPQFYNLINAPLPSMNLTLADHYLNLAGQQDHFYVTLPNGTKIGDLSSSNDLSTSYTFTITGLSPANNVETSQLTIFEAAFTALGLKSTSTLVSPTIEGTWTNASATPQFVDLGWFPDWPDPVAQLMIPAEDVQDGGLYGANNAWLDNATLQTIFANITFQPISTQVKEMKIVEGIVYNLTPEVWLPTPDTYFFVQPYVKNFQYNGFVGYWYNLMYFSWDPSGASSSAVALHTTSPFVLLSSALMMDLKPIMRIF